MQIAALTPLTISIVFIEEEDSVVVSLKLFDWEKAEEIFKFEIFLLKKLRFLRF
jgi:hypothetical protein